MKKSVLGNSVQWLRRASAAVAFCGAACVALHAQEERDVLTLAFNDGTEQSYVLADRPKVTFDKTTLYVEAAGVSDEYGLASVHKFFFDKKIPSSIATVGTGECRLVYVDGENVELSGLTGGVKVSLYDISGCCLGAKAASADGRVAFSLADCKSGVYVIAVEGGRSFKILK